MTGNVDPLFLQRVWFQKPTRQDHHQGPPGRSHRWHQAHTEFVLSLGLSGAEPFSCERKRGQRLPN